MSKLHLIGIDACGLGQMARAALGRSVAVFCTERFKGLPGDFQGEIFPVSPLAVALTQMALQLGRGDIVVLASGDPLFFGIGRCLLEWFGAET
ncbi:MAG: bifunctional cobalt-precorrin-7 (C(5))-methyltransferase/cobalt-precorrin-6B (C(15))-methyltransferase, partial [Pseudomonadota bacterium]